MALIVMISVIVALVAVAVIANARAQKKWDQRQANLANLREVNLRREAERGTQSRAPPPGSRSAGAASTAAARPEDPLDKYFPLVNGFVATESWEDAQVFLKNNLALLDRDAAQVFERIASIQPFEPARNHVLIHKLAVDLCRDQGVDAGIAEVLAHEELRQIKRQNISQVRGGDITQLLERISAFVEAHDPAERRRMVADYPRLTSEVAGDLMLKMEENNTDARKRRSIGNARMLLTDCREIGTEAAFEKWSAKESAQKAPSADRELPPELIQHLSTSMSQIFPTGRSIEGSLSVTNLAPQEVMAFVKCVGSHLEKYPNNVDLLLLKSSALRYAAQYKSGEEVIDEILQDAPDQFDARLIKDHWDTWPDLLRLPVCSLGMAKLPPPLMEELSRRSVFPIRDGIRIGIALILDVAELQFARRLSQEMRCKWEFVLSETPYGRIVANYPFVEDQPNASFLQELILMTGRPDKPNAASGYWLLQRLARIPSALIILCSSNDVLYSGRYVFPEKTHNTLRAIAKLISDDPKRTSDFNAAVKWHTTRFDINSLKFDG